MGVDSSEPVPLYDKNFRRGGCSESLCCSRWAGFVIMPNKINEHGAVNYGTDNSGVVYIYTKNGKFTPPTVSKLSDETSMYGKKLRCRNPSNQIHIYEKKPFYCFNPYASNSIMSKQ